MPYYIYIVTVKNRGAAKSVERLDEFEKFKSAKTEVRKLRTEKQLASYKIIFADSPAEAEQKLTEYREEPIAKEWEK